MRGMGLIICLFGLFFTGCASSGSRSYLDTHPWYSDLDPTNTDMMSDWEIIDMGPKTFSKDNGIVDDLKFDLMETLR